MLKLVFFGGIVWSLLQPSVGSVVYLAAVGLLEGYLLMLNRIDKIKPSHPEELKKSEIAALKKYSVYFRFPFASRSVSSGMGMVVLGSIVLFPWLLYKELWVQCIWAAISGIPAVWLGRRLNPRRYLHHAVENRGKENLRKEMEGVDRLCDRISEYDRAEEDNDPTESERIVSSDECGPLRVEDVAGDMAKVAFHIGGRTQELLREAGHETGVALIRITKEYAHLRHCMVEQAVLSLADTCGGGDKLTEEFYEKSVFCLVVPELFAPGLVGVSGEEFWRQHEERRAGYNSICSNTARDNEVIELACALGKNCGTEDGFVEMMSLCITCVSAGIAVAETLQSTRFSDEA